MWYYDPPTEHPNGTENGRIAPNLALEVPPGVKVAVATEIPAGAGSSESTGMPGSEYWLP
jgi:hypothetical protein